MSVQSLEDGMRRRLIVRLLIFFVFWLWNLGHPPSLRADRDEGTDGQRDAAARLATKTPIKHLVVIFDENISFDHYFGTYPYAVPNLDGSVYFGKPKDDTPLVNGLTPTLLTNNPNTFTGGSNPFRLDRSQAATCSSSNGYTVEQEEFDGGLLDKFAVGSAPRCGLFFPDPPQLIVMGYYDGNTVTALWNYAQNFAMSDNFFDTEFGVTLEGHLNLLSGQTHGVTVQVGPVKANQLSNGTVIGNMQPYYDDCAVGATPNIVMTGKNVGDLMNARGVSWGWFYGDFGATLSGGRASCVQQYNSHYAPFDYYPSTSNQHHIPPASLGAIGTDTCADQKCANHNYDLTYFYKALAAGNLPAVTYLKFKENQTGHAADSTPLEEQTQLVEAVNAIARSPFWRDTAIMITYDDSGGWYDHAAGPIVNQSADTTYDAIKGTPTVDGSCSSTGTLPTGAFNDRCGFGVRLPFVLISPYAKRNYVDHSLNDTTSVLRFIEYNWGLGTIGDPQSFDVLASGTILGMFDFDDENFKDDHEGESRRLFLDPSTGTVIDR
jgi:phospholipase C